LFKKIEEELLECERWWVFGLLMCISGYYGAFTYTLRGGIFCNAQTANFVLFGMAVGTGDVKKALYLIIPITAYLMGAVISELVPNYVKKSGWVRWDTLLIAIEIVTVAFLGLIPDDAPFQISQVAINFICSMQYNTFRQADKVPMATTFCTNHLRQTGIHIVKWLKHSDKKARSRVAMHCFMLASFIIGAIVSAFMCGVVGGKAIWGAEILLLIVFFDLIHADLFTERDKLDMKPSGH
jgi:uncharacterized membrane protein YoaK (UPF0700 family)